MKTLSEIKQELLAKAKGKPIEKYCIKDRNGNICARSNERGQHCFNNAEDEAWAAENLELAERYVMPDGVVRMFYKMTESPEGLFQSCDGKFYTESELPEQSDNFCTDYYSKDVKAERNARISDTDDYVKLPDITVEKTAGAKRSALDDADRLSLEVYRQALRDMPTQEGFPFVAWPIFPTALAYELGLKVTARENSRSMNYGA